MEEELPAVCSAAAQWCLYRSIRGRGAQHPQQDRFRHRSTCRQQSSSPSDLLVNSEGVANGVFSSDGMNKALEVRRLIEVRMYLFLMFLTN